ncbi:hypothetical protein like AT4G29090 [Hibiscus trionum]|uniref:RNase H type-1 domain-containing protein n=1 Tax=Hibiscus trionum TaxID=183268 RepID=A0A9W7H584_HIBTR|nr:hypothetical protein like AT4G29090 [Hibiscus trionum]
MGIRNINIQNRSLLSKWIWKFVVEKDSLWKRVVVAKNNLDSRFLIPADSSGANSSWLWKGIVKSFYSNDEFGSSIRSSIRFQVGDGKTIIFWSDWWIGEGPLLSLFPRIHALSINKIGRVADFGTKQALGWTWKIELRRRLFDWEQDQWSDLMNLLNGTRNNNLVSDCLLWKNTGDGCFSARDCYNFLFPANVNSHFWKSFVWQGLAPPRVDFFIWQLCNNKIPVKQELSRRGIDSISDLNCPLCGPNVESVQHLFLSCNIAWTLWMRLASYWDLTWVIHEETEAVLVAWHAVKPSSTKEGMWNLVSSAIWCSIWLTRNEIVFNKVKLDFSNLLFVTKYRLAVWFLASNQEVQCSLDDLICNPAITSCLSEVRSTRLNGLAWSPPPPGFLKMNVDGAVSRVGGSGGIGGIIRNQQGEVLASFSEQCGSDIPIITEIEALVRGIKMFEELFAGNPFKLIIESDSKLMINWVHDVSSCPVVFKKPIQDVVEFCKANCCSLRHIHRVSNIAADSLAKAGIG